MKMLLKNGTVLEDNRQIRKDILVDGDRIEEIADGITTEADETVDCTGMLITPGFVDACPSEGTGRAQGNDRNGHPCSRTGRFHCSLPDAEHPAGAG